jgi:hypothetical protein
MSDLTHPAVPERSRPREPGASVYSPLLREIRHYKVVDGPAGT